MNRAQVLEAVQGVSLAPIQDHSIVEAMELPAALIELYDKTAEATQGEHVPVVAGEVDGRIFVLMTLADLKTLRERGVA